MSDALVFVKVEPDFILRDPRMLALSFEAKGLYLTLWAMPMDKSPRTETLSWSSRKQMLHFLSSFEPEPDVAKIEAIISELVEQKLITVEINSIGITGFKAKHATLDWGNKRGRKPATQKSANHETATQSHSGAPKNYRRIPEELPENSPTITEQPPGELGRVEKNREEKSREEQRREEEPAARDTTHLPPPGWTDVYKPDYMKRPKRCPLHGQLSKIKLRETNTTSDGKRRLTPDGEKYIAEIYEALSHGDDDIDRQVAAALQMQLELKPLQALKAVAIDPQRLCEYLYASITEAENMGAYLMKMVSKMPDIGDTPVYAAVKKLLFGGNGKRGDGKKDTASSLMEVLDEALG